MMYWRLHDMGGDTGYWEEYLATTYPESVCIKPPNGGFLFK